MRIVYPLDEGSAHTLRAPRPVRTQSAWTERDYRFSGGWPIDADRLLERVSRGCCHPFVGAAAPARKKDPHVPSTLSSKRNRWIAIPGAAVFLALAIGMILAGGQLPVASGYGAAPTCTVTGYTQTCDGKAEHVSTTPKKPKAGKGFTVKFKTSSGGTYKITAKRAGAKQKTLTTGVAGIGSVSVTKLGKKLKAGKYNVKVTVTSNGKSGHASHSMTIKS
jgi:hypothetical protein